MLPGVEGMHYAPKVRDSITAYVTIVLYIPEEL